jgi:hypothetical protein
MGNLALVRRLRVKPVCRTDVRYEAFWATVVLALLALVPFAIRYAAKEFAAARAGNPHRYTYP